MAGTRGKYAEIGFWEAEAKGFERYVIALARFENTGCRETAAEHFFLANDDGHDGVFFRDMTYDEARKSYPMNHIGNRRYEILVPCYDDNQDMTYWIPAILSREDERERQHYMAYYSAKVGRRGHPTLDDIMAEHRRIEEEQAWLA